MELDLKALTAGLISAVVVSFAAHAHQQQPVHDDAACKTPDNAVKACPLPPK